MVFHWSLSGSKSPQVYRTLFSILDDLHDTVVWMVSTRPLISKFFSFCTNPLVTVLRAPMTIGITVTFMFHSFFSSLARSFAFFQFYLVVIQNSKVTTWQVCFIFCRQFQGLVIWLRLRDLFVSQNPREFVCLIFLNGFQVVHIPFVCMFKFKLLAQFPVDHLIARNIIIILIIILLILLLYFWQVFSISFSWWSFIGV